MTSSVLPTTTKLHVSAMRPTKTRMVAVEIEIDTEPRPCVGAILASLTDPEAEGSGVEPPPGDSSAPLLTVSTPRR